MRDVAFREDESRVRVGHTAEHRAVLRHIALNLLRHERSLTISITAKRLRCAWDEADSSTCWQAEMRLPCESRGRLWFVEDLRQQLER